MKLDDILNFLFRTRRGLGVMAISALGGALLTGGCFLTDVMACACDQTGCGVCAGCLSDLDSCVNELCTCGEPTATVARPACLGTAVRSKTETARRIAAA